MASFRRALELAPRPRPRALQPRARAEPIGPRVGGRRRAEASAGHRSAASDSLHAGGHLLASGRLRSRRDRAEGRDIAQQPDYADAHYALGSVLKARKDWKGAAAALRRAIAMRSGSADALHARAGAPAVRRRGRSARGVRRVRAAPSTDRAGSAGQRLDGRRYAEARCRGLSPARSTCSAARPAASDRYAPAYYQMGRALQRLGRDREAREAFRARRAQSRPRPEIGSARFFRFGPTNRQT